MARMTQIQNRLDAYLNTITGLGTTRDKSSYTVPGCAPRLRYQELCEMYESDPIVALANEVSLEFTLPDLEEPIAPTAQVIWRQPPGTRHPPGMGLQFLALDRTSTDRIDDFVYENSDFGDANAAARAAGVQ